MFTYLFNHDVFRDVTHTASFRSSKFYTMEVKISENTLSSDPNSEVKNTL